MRRVFIGLIVALLLVIPLVVRASIPDSGTGKITTCYNNSGTLRVIDKQGGSACGGSETELAWYRSPSSGLATVTKELSVPPGTDVGVQDSVSCSSDRVAMGGGYWTSGAEARKINVQENTFSQSNDIEWKFSAQITASTTTTLRLMVKCVWAPTQ